MNARSSRSHTIFRLVIESSLSAEEKEKRKEKLEKFNEGRNSPDGTKFKSVKDTEEEDNDVSVSFLNLVDLAGSERQRNTKASGTQLKEGANINKSLLALGAVIQKLSEANPESKAGNDGTRRLQQTTSQKAMSSKHIPYRNSKLTRILKTSLGGSTFTHVILAATPSPAYIEETLSTLQFGAMCKLMKNKARLNKTKDKNTMLNEYKLQILKLKETLQEQSKQIAGVGTDDELQKAKEEAKKQKEETESLKERLKQMELALAGKGGNAGQINNIMVKSSLNYNGVRMANVDGRGSTLSRSSGWEKVKRVSQKLKDEYGIYEAQRDLYEQYKATAKREKEKELMIVELKDSIHDLEHEVENLRNEAEDSNDLIEELQQNIADNVDKQQADRAERFELEELLVAKDKKIVRQEALVKKLRQHIAADKEKAQSIAAKELNIRQKLHEQTQINFLMKTKKRSIQSKFLEMQNFKSDYEDAIGIVNYEMQIKAEEIDKKEKKLHLDKLEFKQLQQTQQDEYMKTQLNFGIKEAHIKAELESVNKLKQKTAEMEQSMRRTVSLHRILPALQRRFRQTQKQRLKEYETHLKSMEISLEKERAQIVQERVDFQEQRSAYQAREAHIEKALKNLKERESKVLREAGRVSANTEKYKQLIHAYEEEKNRGVLRERELKVRESAVAEMERVFHDRDKEISRLKSEVEHQLEEAQKLKDDRSAKTDDIRAKFEHLDVTQKAVNSQLEAMKDRKLDLNAQFDELNESKKYIEKLKVDLETKLDNATSHNNHLQQKLLETNALQAKLEEREQELHHRELILMKLESKSRVFAEKEAKLRSDTIALRQQEKDFYNKHAPLIHYMHKKRISDLENHLKEALQTTSVYRERAIKAETALKQQLASRQLVSTELHNGEDHMDEQEIESNPEKYTAEDKDLLDVRSVDPMMGEQNSIRDYSEAHDFDDVESLMSDSTKASSIVVDIDL